jgi:ArsR family transcriptional regulator
VRGARAVAAAALAHLKLLVEAGLLERVPEGANAYFGLPPDADLARMILARLPEDDPQLAADRRQAVRLAAERAREASDAFRRHGADWDENRALDLPAAAIETATLDLLPPRIGAFLDVGTGTGRLLELVAPRAERALGVDASRDMLALARARLAERGLADRCAVRQADMYRLPLPDGGFDVVALQMVLPLRGRSRRRAGRRPPACRHGRAARGRRTSARTGGRSC